MPQHHPTTRRLARPCPAQPLASQGSRPPRCTGQARQTNPISPVFGPQMRVGPEKQTQSNPIFPPPPVAPALTGSGKPLPPPGPAGILSRPCPSGVRVMLTFNNGNDI